MLLFVVGAVVALSLLLPPKYKATAALLIDVKAPDPILGALLPGQMTAAYMATQIDIIQSDRVARRVVTMLKIDENPTARQQWLEETEGKGSIEDYYATLLADKLDVKPSKESNVVNITYKSSEPQFAAAIANAFAQAYIDTNVELRKPIRRSSMQDGSMHEPRDCESNSKSRKASSPHISATNGIVNADERLGYVRMFVCRNFPRNSSQFRRCARNPSRARRRRGIPMCCPRFCKAVWSRV